MSSGDFLDDSFEDTDRVRLVPRRAKGDSGASERITIGEDGLGIGQAAQLAALTGNFPRAGADTMEKQHARLLDAFWDSEGRDPHPDGDPEFWRAHNIVTKAHTGQEPATIPDVIPNLDAEWEQLRKATENGSGDVPAWAEEFAARNGHTVESLRKAIREADAVKD